MSRKKQAAVSRKELRSTVKKLRSKLDKADSRIERLEEKVTRFKRSRAELKQEVRRLAGQATETSAPPEAEPAVQVSTNPVPDSSWTVVRLRAEARSRGVAGATRMTKAQLLTALG